MEIKMGTENESKVNILNEDIMMERGKFTANGHTFIVRPVYLGEEDTYFSEINIAPVPSIQDGADSPSDKELGRFAIVLFSKTINGENAGKQQGLFRRIINWLFHRNDYHYYSSYTSMQPIIKWLERKVTYNRRKIRFYDLERKYGLNKAEIERLIMYFHEISGF